MKDKKLKLEIPNNIKLFLPALVSLLVISIVTSLFSEIFLTSRNLMNVLNQATTPTVSVQLGGTYLKDLNGLTLQNVPADQTYDFRIEEYGTYTILYSSSDTSSRGNLRTETVSFIVVDKEPPVAALSQSSLTVSAGESVDLAAMLTVSDNITPSGELRTVISVRKNRLREYVEESGTYTFTEAGRYYVDYLVRDGAENLVIVTLTVTAE